MRGLQYIIAAIYQSYESRGVDIPYFRTCMTIILSLFFHAVEIGLLFDLPSSYIMPWDSNAPPMIQWLVSAGYFGLLILLFSLVFRYKKIQNIEVDEVHVARVKTIFPIYLAANVIFMFVLLLMKR